MSLFENWNNIAENNGDTQEFWSQYFATEQSIYETILESKEVKITGTVKEFADTHKIEPTLAVAFFDGINTSLKEEIDLESLTEESILDSEIDWEKLYFNMHGAKAEWLYNLEQWDEILTAEKKAEIKKSYDTEMTFIKEGPKVGRNDKCPCGSGKKYKKCCLNK